MQSVLTLLGQFGPICWGTGKDFSDETYSEDCLFVNIWTPGNVSESSKLPVWVFIQGGGYNDNANANWDGTTVIKESGHGLVFVSFNYRVGMWGFLAGKKVEEDGDLNAGLLDQRKLLKWVQKYIGKVSYYIFNQDLPSSCRPSRK